MKTRTLAEVIDYDEIGEVPAEAGEVPARAVPLSGSAALGGPVLFPQTFPLSGRYLWRPSGIPAEQVFEEMRLDVDGTYPQMVASGTITRRSVSPLGVHWIASLSKLGSRHWAGAIWFKDNLGGPSSYPLPYTNVDIVVVGGGFLSLTPASATVTLSGGGSPDRVRVLTNAAPWFRDVEFEFDVAAGVTGVTAIQTFAHPNHPATLPNQNLSIASVFSRAGFDVTKSGKDNVVPLAGAGADELWTNNELHDAMQAYWSRFTNAAQWSMWTLFASRHRGFPEEGVGPDDLGGIMFDDIGPNHRQGAAVFSDSFIKIPPANDPAPAAWVARMRFFAAIHEIGHSFNLAHAWQKSLTTGGHGPWIPVADEPEVRSIMNYPQRVSGGQQSFFADFEYRFSDSELLFMRHAPERFVEMGNADWFDHHGFTQTRRTAAPDFALELRLNRDTPTFEFMEPVVLELKLTNISDQPQLIPENALVDLDGMTVIVKKSNRAARQFLPYARYCFQHRNTVLMPNQSAYGSLFVSAGRGGWTIDEPGRYIVQVALHRDDGDVVSSALDVRVAPPRGYDEEYLAQDLFTDDVGRILALDGSRFLRAGNDTLRAITEQLSDRRVAVHAGVALAMPLMCDYKQLVLPAGQRGALTPAAAMGGRIKVASAQIDEARKTLSLALFDRPGVAATTLGHIDTKYYVDRISGCLADQGHVQEAAAAQDTLYQTLAGRQVRPAVLEEIEGRRDRYKAAASRPASGRR